MKEFTLAEVSLPFNFLEEVNISYEEIAVECNKEKYPDLSMDDCWKTHDKNIDMFSDKLYELNNYII